ncbi:unnamed protein product [Rotaria sp. Silwood2]|nr:unnamed protein product [Rotaria sp. Silwood2]CAF4041086.1 unnamed protein product [Rotaria sp. Silwood2]
MSLEPLPTFLTLPVELIDRILDLLDTESILFSFSAVCKRFHAIAYNYSRLTINFTDTSSKADIQRIRRAMRPENVIALTLKNSSRQSNIIRHFLSSVYIYQSTQLRSLTLCNIEEYDLQTIIKSLTTSKLASLSLSFGWPNEKIFGKLTQLALDINDQQPSDFLKCLSSFIDLSHVNEIWLLEDYSRFLQLETIKNLLEQTSNIRTLVSGRIDHFKIRLRQLHWMKLVLTRLKHVSTVTIQHYESSSNSIPDMIKRLSRKGKTFSVDDNYKSIQIKFDKDVDELLEVKSNHKRLKLVHHRQNS